MHHAMTRRLLYVEYEIEILGHYSFCKLISNNFMNSITKNHIVEFIGLYQLPNRSILYPCTFGVSILVQILFSHLVNLVYFNTY